MPQLAILLRGLHIFPASSTTISVSMTLCVTLCRRFFSGFATRCALLSLFLLAFKLIFSQIRDILPDTYHQLELVAEVMPGGQISSQHPFTGMVVNINAHTLGHRDGKDFLLCIVIPLGNFVGAELCLYEPGLVFPLQNGDLFGFRSFDITHFNLPYTGQRGSIVLHSDIDALTWLKDINNWSHSDYAPN